MYEWNNKFLIAGVSGTGKTYQALWLQSMYIRQNKRSYYVYLSDNSRDYNKDNHIPAIRPKNLGYKLISYNSEHAAKKWKWADILRQHNKLYIETGNLLDTEVAQLVNDLSLAFWSLGHGLFVIDEAWAFLNRMNPPKEYERLARGGRKIGVDLIASTQRVVDIYPNILSQFNVIVSFRLTEINDKERLARYFDPVNGHEAKYVISTLPQGHYLIKLTETGEQEKNTTLGVK